MTPSTQTGPSMGLLQALENIFAEKCQCRSFKPPLSGNPQLPTTSIFSNFTLWTCLDRPSQVGKIFKKSDKKTECNMPMGKLMQGLSFGDCWEADRGMHNQFYYSLYSNFYVHSFSTFFSIDISSNPKYKKFKVHPTKAYLVSWRVRILSLKNSWSRSPIWG